MPPIQKYKKYLGTTFHRIIAHENNPVTGPMSGESATVTRGRACLGNSKAQSSQPHRRRQPARMIFCKVQPWASHAKALSFSSFSFMSSDFLTVFKVRFSHVTLYHALRAMCKFTAQQRLLHWSTKGARESTRLILGGAPYDEIWRSKSVGRGQPSQSRQWGAIPLNRLRGH
jgi:hypothetical protein